MPISQQLYLIVSNTPLWVFFFFALLLFIGLRSTKSRTRTLTFYYFLPLIGLTVLPTLFRLGLTNFTLGIYPTGYLLGAISGYVSQEKWIEAINGKSVSLRGEWVTFATMMILFFSKYLFNVVMAINPDFFSNRAVLGTYLAIISFCSGMFLGRSLMVIKQSRAVSASE